MRKKSITATIATMVLMLNSLCLVAGADNSARQQETCQGDPGYGISNISLEQQLSDYLANPNLTSEQRSAAESKINSAIDLRDGKIQTRTTYQTVTLTVTAYTQETNYYCGPATTRQSLNYLAGYAPSYFPIPSQSELATRLGTTTAGTEWYKIRDYLNGFSFPTFQPHYVEYSPTSSTDMTDTLYSGLTASHPILPILQVNTSGNTTILGYSTSGHYMNVSGIKTENGQVKFQVTDPYCGRIGLSAKYYVSASNLYTITRNHWAKHFLY